MAEFNRVSPLFERNKVPFEIIISSGAQGSNPIQDGSNSSTANKRQGNFTVRILQGHRQARNNAGGDRERVIRFEMSDECNLIDESLPPRGGNYDATGMHMQGTPGGSAGNLQNQTPKVPIIHAPFLTADRGRVGRTVMQTPGRQQHGTSSGLGFRPKQSCAVPNRPIEIYELEVGESDFSDLRRDQALLVDFNDFADSLISLLQLCELGEADSSQPQEQNAAHQTFHGGNHYCQQPSQQPCDSTGRRSNQNTHASGHQWSNGSSVSWSTPSQTHQQPPNQQQQGMQYHGPRTPSSYNGSMSRAIPVSSYTCRLETNSLALTDDSVQWRNAVKPNSLHARFSIVESNQFRELTHLALNLNVGTDKSVRLYLSSRLGQTMVQNIDVQTLYAEQQQRTDATETDLIGLKKRHQELIQSSEAEKCQIRYQVNEQLQTESCSRLAEVNEVKTAKEAEIKSLNEQSEQNRVVLENKIRVLEEVNERINSENACSKNENERLATKLSYQETTNNTLTNELSSLRSQLHHVSEEKSNMEKSLHQLQLQLSSLEYSNNDQERAMVSAEKVSIDAKQTLSRQQSQLEDLRRRLEEAELETSKYKDLTSRYQTNRIEMKKRIKEKVEMVRDQEDTLVVREKETTELRHRVRGLEQNMQQMQMEKESAVQELNGARRQTEDDKKKLENNQQVIAWLNKQVKAPSDGTVWQGSRTSSTNRPTANNTYGCPTPVAASNHASSLPRYMPTKSGVTPYQRSYVTPDVKAATGVTEQLHPEPTPYSRMPGRPDTTTTKRHC